MTAIDTLTSALAGRYRIQRELGHSDLSSGENVGQTHQWLALLLRNRQTVALLPSIAAWTQH
jgi:hypothetical protein